jgi:hypothetical protein
MGSVKKAVKKVARPKVLLPLAAIATGGAAMGAFGPAAKAALVGTAGVPATAAMSGIHPAIAAVAPTKGILGGLLGTGGKLSTAAKLGLGSAGLAGLMMGSPKTEEQKKLGVDAQAQYDLARLMNQKMGGAYTDEELNTLVAPMLSQYGGEYQTVTGPRRRRRPMFPGLNYSGLTRFAKDGGSIKPKKRKDAIEEMANEIEQREIIMDALFGPTTPGMNEDAIADQMFDMMRRKELNPTGRKDGGIMQLAMSDPDPMAERSDMMENIALDKFGKPLNRLSDEEIIQIEEMIDNMMPMAEGGPVSNITNMINESIDEMQKNLGQQIQSGFTTQETIVPINKQEQPPQFPGLPGGGFRPRPFPIRPPFLPRLPGSGGLLPGGGDTIGVQQPAKQPAFFPPTTSHTPPDLSLSTFMGFADGGSIPQTKNIPNGMQLDGRGGGFIPMGARERKDDVPAMLAKNEFVMTADAVRAAGGGDVNVGAQRMYDLMNNLESKV